MAVNTEVMINKPGHQIPLAQLPALQVDLRTAGQASLPSGRYQTSALSEWVTPHLAISQTVRLDIDCGELFEFDFGLSKPRNDTPAHQHQLTLTCLTITPDDGLHTVRCDVVIRARKDDILKIPTDVEMLRYPCAFSYSSAESLSG